MRNTHEPNDIVFEAFPDMGVISGASAVLGKIATPARLRSLPTATRSVTRMAKDYVMQFPMIASAAIPDDDFNAIVKNCEMQYAQFVSMVMTGVSGLTTKDIKNTSDILKMYHSNDDGLDMKLLDYAMSLEGAVVEDPNFSVQFTKDDMAALAYGTDEELTMESLNDMYNPNEAMLRKYERAAIALENHSDDNTQERLRKEREQLEKDKKAFQKQKDKYYADLKDLQHDRDSFEDEKNKFNSDTEYRRAQIKNAQFQNTYDEETKDARIAKVKADAKNAKLDYAIATQTKAVSGSDLNKIQDNGDAPIILTTTVYLDTDGDTIPRTLLFGVKVMPRRVPSSVMVPQVVQALTSNSLAFNFVRYTKGEVKLIRDILFDISSARAEAINHTDNKGAGKWFAAIQRRKRDSKLNRWVPGHSCAPTATIVMTDTEADAVKAACGIDLSEDASAVKFLRDMYLLGFVLYNTANGTVSMMFDGYSNGRFYNSTITGLTAQTKAAPRLDMKTINQVAQMARGL